MTKQFWFLITESGADHRWEDTEFDGILYMCSHEKYWHSYYPLPGIQFFCSSLAFKWPFVLKMGIRIFFYRYSADSASNNFGAIHPIELFFGPKIDQIIFSSGWGERIRRRGRSREQVVLRSHLANDVLFRILQSVVSAWEVNWNIFEVWTKLVVLRTKLIIRANNIDRDDQWGETNQNIEKRSSQMKNFFVVQRWM